MVARGEMTTKVMFKKNTPTTLGAGNKDVYTDLLETRGRFRKRNGSRIMSYGEVVEDNSYELFVDYQIAIDAGLRINSKAEINGRTFTIASIELLNEKKRMYKIILNEQINE